MSSGLVEDKPADKGLGDFVVDKISSYQSDIQYKLPHHNLSNSDQQSILHQHQLMSRQKLAIFCKLEHELAKASGFAVKFRIGDQSFVDQLEGK